MEALQMRKWNPHSALREIGISRASKHRDEAQLARLGKREVLTVSEQYPLRTAKKKTLSDFAFWTEIAQLRVYGRAWFQYLNFDYLGSRIDVGIVLLVPQF